MIPLLQKDKVPYLKDSPKLAKKEQSNFLTSVGARKAFFPYPKIHFPHDKVTGSFSQSLAHPRL